MLDLKLLEEVVPDIEYKTYGDLQEIKLLTEQEIKDMSRKNENDDLCQDDILNLCVTAIHYMKMKQLTIRNDGINVGISKTDDTRMPRKINDDYVSSGTPLEVRFSENSN